MFSQSLSREKAAEALRSFEKFFTAHGIVFAYPVHGGFLGRDARRLAFGRRANYDALGLEFETYETIKQLAGDRKAADTGQHR